MEEIINKVAGSGLKTLDLEEYYDASGRADFDLAQTLFQGLVLREKDFRAFVKDFDWNIYADKNVAVFCSADAIVPVWAFMLVATKLSGIAKHFILGDRQELEKELFRKALAAIDPQDFLAAKVVIKGCSKLPVPTSAYLEITKILAPVASSIMYGEPCSTVPVYKKK